MVIDWIISRTVINRIIINRTLIILRIRGGFTGLINKGIPRTAIVLVSTEFAWATIFAAVEMVIYQTLKIYLGPNVYLCVLEGVPMVFALAPISAFASLDSSKIEVSKARKDVYLNIIDHFFIITDRCIIINNL